MDALGLDQYKIWSFQVERQKFGIAYFWLKNAWSFDPRKFGIYTAEYLHQG